MKHARYSVIVGARARARYVDGDTHAEVVTGGYYFDGTRHNSQLIVWGMI
jgi:hypothetical protein